MPALPHRIVEEIDNWNPQVAQTGFTESQHREIVSHALAQEGIRGRILGKSTASHQGCRRSAPGPLQSPARASGGHGCACTGRGRGQGRFHTADVAAFMHVDPLKA